MKLTIKAGIAVIMLGLALGSLQHRTLSLPSGLPPHNPDPHLIDFQS